MKRIPILIIIILCAAGCAVGPDYKRPDIDVPQSYRYEPGQAAETANTQWWKHFNDPVLDLLIAEALAHNRDVKIAVANIEAAQGILMTTRSALFPQVDYTGSALRQRLSRNAPIPEPEKNPFTNLQVFAGASWEIDLWGRIRRLSEAAKANLLATEEARRGVILSLVAEVSSSYVQLRALDEQLEISKRTLATYGDSVRIFELQQKYGQVSKITVEQARSQYETAAVQIPQIETQIALTENALSILLGRNPGPIARGKVLGDLLSPAIPAGLPSQLLERRPDILQAEQNLIAANAQIGAARALYFPSISLTGALGVLSTDTWNLFRGPSTIWNYGGSITGPIFTAGNIAGQVATVTAGQKAALESYVQTIQKAFADVENALVSRQKLGEQSMAEERRVAAYREYARLARLKYVGGYTSYLEVLYSETQLFPAELSLVQARASTLIAVSNIYKAMGGGWVTAADEMTEPSGKD
ncbi:MAG TPA: efflux transporter outer membrane subunit [Syntrophorhabdaceae bacterium]